MSKRRRARELALQAFYATEVSRNNVEKAIVDWVRGQENMSPDIVSFAEELLTVAYQHNDEIDELIKARALNWDFDRIAILDKLIIRQAICEFIYFSDIPPKVSIDEAIEISKKFSTENSGKFINGILDSVLSDLRDQDRLHKKGRGLIE
ncbi:transcription antitermination factor NusB [bacterium]|nr:transcription antitermination factor NusB [bacterium]